MRTWLLILKYNGKYIAIASVLFFAFWHVLSVFQAVGEADRRIRTVFDQNAERLERSLARGDLFSLKELLWSGKSDEISFIHFEQKMGAPLLRNLSIGDLSGESHGWIKRHFKLSWNGLTLGTVSYGMDLGVINFGVIRGTIALYAIFVLALALALGFSSLGAIRSIRLLEGHLQMCSEKWNGADRKELSKWWDTAKSSMPTSALFGRFLGLVEEMMKTLRRAGELEIELKTTRALSEQAAQVSHDIRSPLAVLDMVTTENVRPTDEGRVLMRRAIQQIKDIANNLLARSRQTVVESAETKQVVGVAARAERSTKPEHLLGLIEAAVSEKCYEFRKRKGVLIETVFDADSYSLFSSIDASELRRILSNLINNSVEAVSGAGRISVRLAKSERDARVSVSDDGQGICQEIIARLGQRGETYGKSGGNGLGLYHARTTVESWGGSLEIRSEPGEGAEIALVLPLCSPAKWFISELAVEPGQQVIVLDDHETIYEVWRRRLDGADFTYCSTVAAFEKWMEENGGGGEKCLFLIDYDLRNDVYTGLDLAEKYGIEGSSVLVTNRHEEADVRCRCEELALRLIPKGLAAFVPVRMRGSSPVGRSTLETA